MSSDSRRPGRSLPIIPRRRLLTGASTGAGTCWLNCNCAALPRGSARASGSSVPTGSSFSAPRPRRGVLTGALAPNICVLS